MNKRKLLAFSRELIAKRKSGDRVGLLVISLHCWRSGLWFEERPEVARLVLPPDVAVAEADWSVCLALDVVLCGAAVDGVFNDAVRAVVGAGAVSAWGEYADGLYLLSVLPSGSVVAVGDAVPAARLGGALRSYRSAALALRLDGYRSRVFDAARTAMFAPLLSDLQAAQHGVGQ